MGRYDVPPADEFTLWLPAQLGAIVNSPTITNLFALQSSHQTLLDMILEEHSIIQSRVALYTCEATFKLSRAFINKVSDSVLLHALYREQIATTLPIVFLALSAAVVSNYAFVREELCLHFTNISQVQSYIQAVRTGCQSGSMFPIRAALSSHMPLSYTPLWEHRNLSSWQIHMGTLEALLALITEGDTGKANTPRVDNDPKPSPSARLVARYLSPNVSQQSYQARVGPPHSLGFALSKRS